MSELPDRMLRGALGHAGSTTPSDLCVDASALAAWADGTMAGAARTAFESHAADCARCQALMAAMARSEPPLEIHAAWWRRSPFSWLMPLAAAAAAVVIVVDLARVERQAPPATAQVPAASAVAPPAAITGAAPAPSAAPPVIARAPVAGPADSRRARAIGNASTRLPGGGPPVADKPGHLADKVERRASPPPPPVAAPAPSVPPPAAAREFAAAPAAGQPPGMTAAKDSTAAPLPAAAAAAQPRAEGASALLAARSAKPAGQAPMLITSPDRESLWRIAGGAIEYSADGGRTWQPPSSVLTAPIRAAAAPAARVCWLVGERGLVLRTTDGRTWVRIASPEQADLAVVQAIDEAHATVTTASGSIYVTNDGGKTWSRR